MYLAIFLADFTVFRVSLGILRDFAEVPEFRGSATAQNIRSPDCSLVQPILEYASLVWAALPNCLVQLVESVQKSALGIIFQIALMSRHSCAVACLHCCRAMMRLAGVLYLTSRSLGSFHTCCCSPRMSLMGTG